MDYRAPIYDRDQYELLKSDVFKWNQWRELNENKQINLAGSDLSNIYLIHANLSRANLINANLTNTCLIGSNLTQACFVEANLTNTNITSTNLFNTYFINANLTNTKINSKWKGYIETQNVKNFNTIIWIDTEFSFP